MGVAHSVTPAAKAHAVKLHPERPLTAKESGIQFAALLNAPPQTTQQNMATTAQSAPTTSEELPRLLQRFCSALYVDAQPGAHASRMLITLDAALPGAAAELIREGAFLRVRLRADNDAAYRVMSGQRDSLNAALTQASPLNVSVEIVRDEEDLNGRAR